MASRNHLGTRRRFEASPHETRATESGCESSQTRRESAIVALRDGGLEDTAIWRCVAMPRSGFSRARLPSTSGCRVETPVVRRSGALVKIADVGFRVVSKPRIEVREGCNR